MSWIEIFIFVRRGREVAVSNCICKERPGPWEAQPALANCSIPPPCPCCSSCPEEPSLPPVPLVGVLFPANSPTEGLYPMSIPSLLLALPLACSQPAFHLGWEKWCCVFLWGALHGALLHKQDTQRGKVLEGLYQKHSAGPGGCTTTWHYPAAGSLTRGDRLEMIPL